MKNVSLIGLASCTFPEIEYGNVTFLVPGKIVTNWLAVKSMVSTVSGG